MDIGSVHMGWSHVHEPDRSVLHQPVGSLSITGASIENRQPNDRSQHPLLRRCVLDAGWIAPGCATTLVAGHSTLFVRDSEALFPCLRRLSPSRERASTEAACPRRKSRLFLIESQFLCGEVSCPTSYT